ncbi:hypothetical protein NC651_039892 [Populus alba x Populus x berolinensis]|nr:hypothetical protein NC651_039892 [Populus alba x Populus x berolinensis]
MRMSLMCKQKGQSPNAKEILSSNLKRPSSEPKVAAAKEYLNQLGREPHPTRHPASGAAIESTTNVAQALGREPHPN